MPQQSLAGLLGKKDVVTEYLVNRPSLEVITRQKRIKAEIIFKDGTRRFFPCRANTKEQAVDEILHFVDCMQQQTGQSVVWCFAGEKKFYIGTNRPTTNTKGIRARLFDYFFGLED
ncbi:DUF6018 family natural product bioysynthesis protein [Sutcliffiella sp. NPDC057660]|uniref:DUF6018 family natural product bioysynthesis protein n=1 Tax=Sutcliffiella sp. NPDC057660 TaxID=3346199 RepID=UPI0036CEB5AB